MLLANQSNKFIPRAVIVDLDPTSVEEVRNSEMGNMFYSENIMNGLCSADTNWALGRYIYSDGILHQTMDRVKFYFGNSVIAEKRSGVL